MQKTTTFLMFVGEQAGKAEEAINFYISLFENATVLNVERYGPGEGEPEGSVKREVRLGGGPLRRLVAVEFAT